MRPSFLNVPVNCSQRVVKFSQVPEVLVKKIVNKTEMEWLLTLGSLSPLHRCQFWTLNSVWFRYRFTVQALPSEEWIASRKLSTSSSSSFVSLITLSTFFFDLQSDWQCPFFLHLWQVASLAGQYCRGWDGDFPHLVQVSFWNAWLLGTGGFLSL